MAPFEDAMRALTLADGQHGAWAEGTQLSGLKVAYDAVNGMPTAPAHSMMQQMRDAAVSQGLLAPPACPYTGLAAGGVAAMPVWPAM